MYITWAGLADSVHNDEIMYLADGAVRVGLVHYNTAEEVDRLLRELEAHGVLAVFTVLLAVFAVVLWVADRTKPRREVSDLGTRGALALDRDPVHEPPEPVTCHRRFCTIN
jgi:hypothetical protein